MSVEVPEGWTLWPFEKAFSVKNDKSKQIQKADYTNGGSFPIIDQGINLVAGYANGEPNADFPVIIFGDHTRCVKWVDEPFFAGADGTQALYPKNGIDPKFGYFLMVAVDLPNLGYSRHMRELKRCNFLVPPLIEQQRIVDILSSVDESIRATEAVIVQSERVKRGLMEDLLTGGLGSAAVANGEFPEGWEYQRVAGITVREGLQTGPFGSQLKASEYCENTTEDSVCVVMPKDIINGRVDYSKCSKITQQKAIELSRHALVTGDVLFSRRGDLSKIAVVDETDPPSICGTGCLRMRPDLVRVDYQFLRLVFTTHDCVQWLVSNAVGATMLNLNTDIIGRLPLLLPPKSEQVNIAKSVQVIELSARTNSETLHQLQRLKRGLMDDLLTGKVRTVG